MGGFLDPTCRVEVTIKTVKMFMQLYHEGKPEAVNVIWELAACDHEFAVALDGVLLSIFRGESNTGRYADIVAAAVERELQSFYTIADINKWADEVNV